MKTTNLYDKKGCEGFVKRADGAWWIQDGQLTSMSPNQMKKLERYAKTVFLNERTPYFSECLGYLKALLKHRLACAFYVIAKKLTG